MHGPHIADSSAWLRRGSQLLMVSRRNGCSHLHGVPGEGASLHLVWKKGALPQYLQEGFWVACGCRALGNPCVTHWSG